MVIEPAMVIKESLTESLAVPTGVSLAGRLVRLDRLDASLHAEGLFQEIEQSPEVWQYLADPPPQNQQQLFDRLQAQSKLDDPLFYAITESTSGAVKGLAAYLRIAPKHHTIEVGHLLFAPSLQRTAGATEAMYLMARHAFEILRYRRYEWKCNARNEPSMRAATRFGFTYEGTFRKHMIVKGENRDTAWFSLLNNEWPFHKQALEAWLDPSNFDGAGVQKRALSSFVGCARAAADLV